MINDWINTRFLFWSLNVCITNCDFSNVLSISKCLISFTNRKLNMRTFVDTSLLLIDWKTSFSISSLISFYLNATNWKNAMCTIESSLKTTTRTNNEIEAKTRSTIALNTKLRNAVNAKYFRNRSRSRLNKFERISDSDFWSFEIANWSFDWDIFDDFVDEADSMNKESAIEIKSDEFSKWSSS
jgi:hypothetical protein